MTPTTAGRHCAACQQTVVDFTHRTDAEILAFLARAAGARTCGRFAAGQLERPLQRAAPAAPTARWRSWLAAAAAVWAVREFGGFVAHGQAPAVQCAKGKAVATSEPGQAPQSVRKAMAPWEVSGVVVDAASRDKLPGVTVLIKGTRVGVSTGADGAFALPIPETVSADTVVFVVSSVGYTTQERIVRARGNEILVKLIADDRIISGVVVVPSIVPPAPWHLQRFYYWGAYWLKRPFRRG